MRSFFIFALILMGATVATADTYRAINRLYVQSITPDTFEVIEDYSVGARGIWCAAADYVQAIGRDRTGLRMYVQEPRGPSRTVPNRIGVVFTIRPDEVLRDTAPSYSVTVKRVGENLPVHHARLFCDVFIEDLFDRF